MYALIWDCCDSVEWRQIERERGCVIGVQLAEVERTNGVEIREQKEDNKQRGLWRLVRARNERPSLTHSAVHTTGTVAPVRHS